MSTMDNEADLTTAASLPEIDVTGSSRTLSTMDNEADPKTAASLPEIDVTHIATTRQSQNKYYEQRSKPDDSREPT